MPGWECQQDKASSKATRSHAPGIGEKQENVDSRLTADPEVKGYLPGVPRIMHAIPISNFSNPAPRDNGLRICPRGSDHLHERGPHPAGPLNFWLGDSRGRWEGDTLVVDVVHFTDQTWFDRAGNFHGDRLHLIERYTLIGPDHMNYEVTIEDPMVFTRPWK